jgi:uncharacterized protein YciI
MREQTEWAEHAEFMDALAAEGLIVLGGPIGSGEDTLLIFNAAGEDAIRARLEPDPWTISGLLEIGRIEAWTILLDGRR